jgi:hypothetical protein
MDLSRLFNFIKQDLLLENKSIKDINKPKNKLERYDFVQQAYNSLIVASEKTVYKNVKGRAKPVVKNISRREASKIIRQETGLKFSDIVGKQFYEKALDIKPSVRYAPKLPTDKLPNIDKLPIVSEHPVLGTIVYGFKVYSLCKDKKTKIRSIRDNNNTVIYSKKYNRTKSIIFRENRILTKRQVLEIFSNYIQFEQGTIYDSNLDVSDYQGIFEDFGICDIVGFTYDRAFRT